MIPSALYWHYDRPTFWKFTIPSVQGQNSANHLGIIPYCTPLPGATVALQKLVKAGFEGLPCILAEANPVTKHITRPPPPAKKKVGSQTSDNLQVTTYLSLSYQRFFGAVPLIHTEVLLGFKSIIEI